MTQTVRVGPAALAERAGRWIGAIVWRRATPSGIARAGIAIALVVAPGMTLGAAQKETIATMHAKGSFSVKLTPQTTDPILGRMTVAKELHGDLEGTSTGEMLTAMTTVKDSAGYVAIERTGSTSTSWNT
jgi:hypothetical protein